MEMMASRRPLPQSFLDELSRLERAYLAEDDPIRQSGFSGGPTRWKAERSPLLQAIEADGEFIDIGCANGYLLECLVAWGNEAGIRLVPYGLDQGAALIDLAKERFPNLASHFYVGNSWDWAPPKQFTYAYTLYDCVPEEYLAEHVWRLLDRVVAPRGRLILGAYGSRSDSIPPFEIAHFLESREFDVSGKAYGGEPAISAFAWIDQTV